MLLEKGRNADAITILILNAEEYAKSGDVYDSVARYCSPQYERQLQPFMDMFSFY